MINASWVVHTSLLLLYAGNRRRCTRASQQVYKHGGTKENTALETPQAATSRWWATSAFKKSKIQG
jgi:hypothetical protein